MFRGAVRAADLFIEAERQLQGVGDATAGEWREVGGIAVHLRRRLTPAEMARGGIVDICDVRGTADATRRIERVRPLLPPSMRHLPVDLLP